MKKKLKIFIQSFVLSIRAKTRASLFCSLLGFPLALFPALSANLIKKFTNDIYNLGDGKKVSNVVALLIALFCVYFCQAVYSFMNAYFSQRDKITIERMIKERVIAATCNVQYKYIENYENFRSNLQFINTKVSAHVAGCIQSMLMWLQSFIALLSIAYVLGEINVWLILIVIFSCLPSVYISRKNTEEEFYTNFRRSKDHLMVINDFTELVGPKEMQEVKHWGLSSKLKQDWRNDAEKYVCKKNKLLKKHFISNIANDLFRNTMLSLVIIIAVYNVFQYPSRGLGTFMLVFTMIVQIQTLMINLLTGITQYMTDIKYLKVLFSLEDLEKELYMNESIQNGNIVFKNVSFKYPETNEYVINDLSVKIEEGERVAIVGANGSGKTTFVNLLCGFYCPTYGEIYIGGQKGAARSIISAVFQNFTKYSTTFRENITISDIEKPVTSEEFEQFCNETGVYQFGERLSDGYNTEIGNNSLYGSDFSGGQWQKIAIARALYRSNAKIMILDEPAASLDPQSELELYQSFADFCKGKTTILITHRLGAIKYMDRILVFSDGKIIEDGSHEELMKINGVYSQMYTEQEKQY